MRRISNLRRVCSRLDPDRRVGPVRHRHALLLNPFELRGLSGSLGRRARGLALELTSLAAYTPEEWTVLYWDENLSPGPPPAEPFPQVVCILVHRGSMSRAVELAQWYRVRGALAVLGSRDILACSAVTPHADILLVGDGMPLWPTLLHDIDAGRPARLYHDPEDDLYLDRPAIKLLLQDMGCLPPKEG